MSTKWHRAKGGREGRAGPRGSARATRGRNATARGGSDGEGWSISGYGGGGGSVLVCVSV